MNMSAVRKTAFVLENGEYRPIPVCEVVQDGKWLPPYDGRFFVRVHRYLMEVEQETYMEFHRATRRMKYLEEEARLHGQISYNATRAGEELIVDILTNVEDEALREVMIEAVSIMVEMLPPKDHKLIKALFYENMTEREYSEITGIPQTTINSRKALILGRMKKALGK